MTTVQEQISSWSQEKVIERQKQLAVLIRHAIKTGQPNLLNEELAADMTLMVDAFEELTGEIEQMSDEDHEEVHPKEEPVTHEHTVDQQTEPDVEA